VAAGTTGLKVALGDSTGEDAPFAFFGIALTLAGWAGGARTAFLLTPLLTLVWWYYFLGAEKVFTFSGPLTLALEGLAIGLVLTKMERTRDALRAARDHSERFRQLTSALAIARTPEEIGTAMVTQGVAAVGASSAFLIKPSGAGQLRLVASQGLPEQVVKTFGCFAVLAPIPPAEAFREKTAVWLESPAAQVARYSDVTADTAISGAAAALPLMSAAGEVLGVAGFLFARPRDFPEADRSLILTLASLCGQALERAELYVDEIAARRRLTELDELTSNLSLALNRDEVARVVVERGVSAVGADICTLYALDEHGALYLIGDRGVSPEVLERIRRIDSSSGNPAFSSLATGESRWVEDEQGYESYSPELASLEATGPRAKAFWAVPLIAEGKAFGLLGMGFFQPRRFPPEERVFVETFARHCAETLRRAERLEGERRARVLADRLQSSLATMLRSIGDAVIATDAAGNVTFMNPVAEELTGWAEADASGEPLRHVFHIVSEQSREVVETPVERVLREGVVVGLANHTLLASRDRSRFIPIDDSGAPIRALDGAIEGVVLVFRDVSKKRREEARLLFLAEAMRVLGESLDYTVTLAQVAKLAVPELADWVAVDVSEEGSGLVKRLAVAHVDPAKAEFARDLNVKYPPDPNASRGVYNVIRTGRAELYPVITDEMLRAGARDEEHLRISRELMLRSAMVAPLTARGHVLGAITFVAAESAFNYGEEDLNFAVDLAARCALAIDNARLFSGERDARHSADLANRAKDEFLAKVSHELRTPLNAIMGWAHMLSSDSLADRKKERAIETIQRNSGAMAQLIEDLLDVSRIISGKMRLETQTVELSRAIEAALESERPIAAAKGVSLVCELDEPARLVRGDPARIQQIVWNLVSNAVKFTGSGGRVEITLRPEPGVVVLRVMDNGKGIEPTRLPHVFDAFWQEESGHAQSRSGLGLGLAIAKQLVELHGGSIEAKSAGIGHGASFEVRLPSPNGTSPALQLEKAQPPARTLPDTPEMLQGLNVLVIDDDDDARTLVRTVLEECGSTVQTAGSAAEGLALFEARVPDVLISDIGMPGQDGYEVIRSIRALPAARGGGVPAAALTAFARAEDRRRLLNAGYSIHISKPVEPAELVAVVATLGRSARPQSER
jgi:PAS domain S-box-containing protein